MHDHPSIYFIDTTIELNINDVVLDVNDQLIKAYPNPCSDLLWIKNMSVESDLEINLYNTTGELLGVWQLNDNTQIDVESLNLAQGLYYLIAHGKYNRYQTLPVIIN